MSHGARELDVPHTLAPYLSERHLDAALLADDPAMLETLVLAAQALVVLDRTEYLRAEKPVPLRLEGTVVDGLGLLDLPVGPGSDFVRRREPYTDCIEAFNLTLLLEQIQ